MTVFDLNFAFLQDWISYGLAVFTRFKNNASAVNFFTPFSLLCFGGERRF